ncbi:MAG: hypothetical protein ABSE97_06560 [Verrucomicrobiota bacterium]
MSTIQAQEREDPKFSSKAESRAKSLSQQIQQEIIQLKNHEWAGEYYEGDGTGENVSLLIAPKHGYVFEWHGCLGLYDRNYGSVTVTNGKLQLSFTFTNKHEGFEGIAEKFVPVHWGDRKYLIPANDMVGFCNAVNSREEPRNEIHGRFLLSQGDEKKKVTGKPSIPAEFTGYLLKAPIEANIIKVISSKSWTNSHGWQVRETGILINAGKKQGLLPGMELSVTSPDIVESLTVKTVADQQAEGIIKQIDEKDVPEIGWKFSTIPRWRLREYQATPE